MAQAALATAVKSGAHIPVAQGVAPPPRPVVRPELPVAPPGLSPWVIATTLGGFGLLLLVGISYAVFCLKKKNLRGPTAGAARPAAPRWPALLRGRGTSSEA